MRRVLIVLAMVLLMAGIAQAQTTKQLTFTWSQTLPSPNDLAGWHIYKGSVAGGPYSLYATVLFTAPASQYTSTQSLTVPEGTSNHCFVLDAYDVTGNKSAYSNEVCKSITVDTIPPNIPAVLTITVQ
jgi:hypothetical protein